MEVTPLFREAAVSAASVPRDGQIVLTRPVSHTALTVLFAGIAVLVVLFLGCFSVTRKTHVAGVLLPARGIIRVHPPQVGNVAEVRVTEGQFVHAGEVLFVISSERSSTTQSDVEQTIERLLKLRRDSIEAERGQQKLQIQQRLSVLRSKADDLSNELLRIEDQIALQQRRVELAGGAVTRQTDLHGSNFVSAASVQDREADLIDQQQRLADLTRVRVATRRDLFVAQADLRDLHVRAQRDQEAATRAVAVVEQELAENDARRQAAVSAPHDGIVTAIVARAGASVGMGETLAMLLPAGSMLEAELYAPSRAAGFVRPGMQVLIRYQAYPYQKFGQFEGRVREISGSPLHVGEVALPAIAQGSGGGEPVYRVRVDLDSQYVKTYGRYQALKPGMVLEASVLLDRRRVYEWMLEPLYSIAGRV